MLSTHQTMITNPGPGWSGLRPALSGLLTLSVAFSIAMTVSAQIPSAPPEDPVIFEMFLRYHRSVAQFLAEEQTKTPLREHKDLAASAAAIFRIDPADFSLIPPVYDRLKIQQDAVDDEGRSYISKSLQKGQQPDINVLRGFEQRRGKLVHAAMSELKARLSAPGWNSLCDYINMDFAPQVKRRPVK